MWPMKTLLFLCLCAYFAERFESFKYFISRPLHCTPLKTRMIGSPWGSLETLKVEDISPNQNGQLVKKLMKLGSAAEGNPLHKDEVQVNWKMMREDESVIFERFFVSTESDTPIYSVRRHIFDNDTSPYIFIIGVNDSRTFTGWEIAVKSMFVGEISRFEIDSALAFGSSSYPPHIEPNQKIILDVELLSISPSLGRLVKHVDNEVDVENELMEDIWNGNSPFSYEAMHNKQIKGDRKHDEVKMFDPQKHRLDPKRKIFGSNDWYAWEENIHCLEVEIPLMKKYSKNDLLVHIRSSHLLIRDMIENVTLLEGPFHGCVNPSDCSWSLQEPDLIGAWKGHRLCLYLDKVEGHKDIWANVLQGEYIRDYGKNFTQQFKSNLRDPPMPPDNLPASE